jgi:hypothetical protein
VDDGGAARARPARLPSAVGTGSPAASGRGPRVPRTASSARDDVGVTDRWGGRWLVRCWRAPVAPAPRVPAGREELARLLEPVPPMTAGWVASAAAPAASWVMGRSARWQGRDAPGAGVDALAAQAGSLRVRLAALAGDGEPSPGRLVVLLLRTVGDLVSAARTARAEVGAPWLVELRDPVWAGRSATWLVAGEPAAAGARGAVVADVRAGRLPEPPNAQLVDVRDPRPRAVRP